MNPTGIYIDKNFIIVICVTIGLVASCVAYLKLLSVMLKNKYWKAAVGILIVLFSFTVMSIIRDFYVDVHINETTYLKLLIYKIIVIAHGIYFLSVELGRSQGLRKTTVSLNDNQILLVLLTLALTNTMVNLHTLNWSFDRVIIVVIFDVLFAYLAVNIVFYLGEVKYYFLYALPMILAFTLIGLLSSGFAEAKRTAFLQTQVALILTLVLSAIYLFIKMQYEIVESRSIIRKIDAVDIEELGLK